MKKLILIAALATLAACDPPAPTTTDEPRPPREQEQCPPDEVCAYP